MRRLVVGMLVLVLWPLPVSAHHTEFQLDIDRFELDGSVLGALDGISDFVDDFDDGVLAPWTVPFGTATEVGGVLRISNPGVHYGGVPPLIMDLSNAQLAIGTADTGGDFVATAFVSAFPVQPNSYSQLSVFLSPSLDPQEQIGIALANFDSDTAAYFPGLLPGLVVGQFHFWGFAYALQFDIQSVPRQLDSITGPVILKLSFDDASNAVSTSFSLDGGATFESPFVPQQPTLLPTGAQIPIILGSDPVSLEPTAIPSPTATATPAATATATPTPTGAAPTDTPTATPAAPTDTPTTTPASLCGTSPRTECRTAGKSMLLLKDNATDDAKDKLVWKWIKGQATTQAEFGEPVSTTDYALCVYAGTASTLLTEVNVPADGTKWSPISTKGFSYQDPMGAEAGIQKVILKGSAEDKAMLLVKGKGATLPDSALGSVPVPVTAQLVNKPTAVCWEAAYDAGDIIKNEQEQLKAKTTNP